MAATCEVRDPDTEGYGEQDLTPRGDLPSSPEENLGKTRGRKRRRRKARLTGLSQQRQAANARERYRTKSVQDALQQLSCCIPTPIPTPATKLSKIEILRLASQYIEHLTNVLNENDPSGTGASKARPEDDTGAAKTKGSSRARRSRSRHAKDDETVVYLTRRRMKDLQPEDKGPTELAEKNVDPTHLQDKRQKENPESSSDNSNDEGLGATQNRDVEQITVQNSGNHAIGSDSESRHCKGSDMKHLQTGSKETGNGNSGRPYNVCELDVKLPGVESRCVVSETCAQVSCTKYAVRGPQCYNFRDTTGSGGTGSGEKLYHLPYVFCNRNGVSGLPECRNEAQNGFGVSHQNTNGTRSFASCQMTDFATRRGTSGFSDYSGFHCTVMPRSAQYEQNFSFESDGSNLSISR